jgi:hypothetical protein
LGHFKTCLKRSLIIFHNLRSQLYSFRLLPDVYERIPRIGI